MRVLPRLGLQPTRSTATTVNYAGFWKDDKWPTCWPWLLSNACGNRILGVIETGWMDAGASGEAQHRREAGVRLLSVLRSQRKRHDGSVGPRGWRTLEDRTNLPDRKRRMWTGSLRSASLAGLVSAYHAGHAGSCSIIRAASTRRKKLPTRKCGSAYRNCATCSPHCYGADGTALNTCGIGPSGEDDINSKPMCCHYRKHGSPTQTLYLQLQYLCVFQETVRHILVH